MLATLRSAASWALDRVLPPRCVGCGMLTGAAHSLCLPCWQALPPLLDPHCPVCAETLPLGTFEGAQCGGCLADPPRFAATRAPHRYDGTARLMVLALKHGARETLATPMGSAMARAAGDWLAADTLLVPVPLHRSRLGSRGFNQSAWLARAIARHGGMLSLDLLIRRRATESTKGKGRVARLKEMTGAFAVPPAARAQLKDRHVILVDDVMTSGATARACARTLRRAGAASVKLLVYARVAPDRTLLHL